MELERLYGRSETKSYGKESLSMNATRGVFIFLVVLGVMGVAMLFDGIGRMKRNGAPPFNDGLVTSVDALARPPGRVLLKLEKGIWRWTVWVVAIVLPVVSGVLAFRKERSVFGWGLLLVWTGMAGFFGIWVWLYSAFHKFKM
jgi:hypothetical protein